MAAGKTSFVLYASYVHSVDLLTNEQAGKLFKHILKYVNDFDPKEEDALVRVAFEPIKQQLKRDLKSWKSKKKKRAAAGKKGGLAKASNAKQNVANLAVNDNENVNVNVNGNVLHKDNNWDSIKLNFFNGWRWKEKFCTDKKIEMPRLEELMQEFINDVELKEDFKSLKDLKSHFTNKFNKNGTNSPATSPDGTSAQRLRVARDW